MFIDINWIDPHSVSQLNGPRWLADWIKGYKTGLGHNGFKPTYLLSWDENIHAILCSILRSDFCVPNYTTQCCKTEKGRSFAIWKDFVLITPMNKIFYYFYTEYI